MGRKLGTAGGGVGDSRSKKFALISTSSGQMAVVSPFSTDCRGLVCKKSMKEAKEDTT